MPGVTRFQRLKTKTEHTLRELEILVQLSVHECPLLQEEFLASWAILNETNRRLNHYRPKPKRKPQKARFS